MNEIREYLLRIFHKNIPWQMELCVFRSSLPPYEIHTFGFEIDDIFSRPNIMNIAYVYRNQLTNKIMFEDSITNRMCKENFE